ncbi:MAG: tRNA (adenosine(37)-N6)-threonylcarbamoyltransferase complex dimerization subunit type 1 TsaB [Firmicutes bacterium]|nr:tRNA (adenosine(37)-N6)-threonylcarbamoyltransferase complex dimerization subunit type 1 TsaB [Candidatus Caballimonas caccae]
MNYLAIDTSGKNLTVIIEYNNKKEVYFNEDCGVNHSVKVMPKIEELKEKLDCDFNKLDFVAVVIGAGSFTGIRIGLSTAKAICFAYSIPILSITSFDTIAYNTKKEKRLAVIDAKHDSFYVCGYDCDTITKEPSFIDKTELIKLSKKYDLISFEKIEGFDVEKVDICEGLINAIHKKYNEKTLDYDSASALYIRKSQAEEGR